MEHELYRQEVKDKFLNEYTEETKTYYRRILSESAKFENDLGKDLSNFNSEEIRLFLKDINPETIESSRLNGRIVSAYINWAINNGLRDNSANPLLGIKLDWYDQFVVDSLSLYITKDQLDSIEKFCNNYQDFVILALIFDGIEGKGCSEITNLKKTDILANESSLLVYRNGEKQKIQIMKSTMKAVQKAANEKEYLKLNGEAEGNSISQDPYIELADTNFVLRNTVTRSRKYGDTPIARNTIYRRLNLIKETFDNGELGFMKVKNIAKSGMIYMAKRMLDTGRELDQEACEYIAVRFGKHPRDWWRIKEWCNKEVVESLYGKSN